MPATRPSDAGPAGKAALRAEAQARRRAFHAAEGTSAAAALADAELPFLKGGEVVAGYHPIGSELDVLPLMLRLARRGHVLALPVVIKRGAPLTFRRWRPEDALGEGWQGIGEPTEAAPAVRPDVLLVPLLLVDRAGYRLGYGAGYYDISLAGLRAEGPVTAVGIAYAAQVVEVLPHEPHDEPLDWLLTEAGAVPIAEPRRLA